jgi:hypothetical protein
MPTFRFGFKKSGMIGHATPEQRTVIESLQAGKITPEEAAKQLGGHAHVFAFRAGPQADEEGEREGESEPPEPEVWPALMDPGLLKRLHVILLVVTVPLAVAVVLGGATVHEHALTAVVWAILSLIIFGGLTARVGLRRTPGGTVLATVPLLGAWVVLDWGLLVGVTHSWSIYFPGLVVIGLGVGVLIAALLVGYAARRTRATLDELGRRRD